MSRILPAVWQFIKEEEQKERDRKLNELWEAYELCQKQEMEEHLDSIQKPHAFYESFITPPEVLSPLSSGGQPLIVIPNKNGKV